MQKLYVIVFDNVHRFWSINPLLCSIQGLKYPFSDISAKNHKKTPAINYYEKRTNANIQQMYLICFCINTHITFVYHRIEPKSGFIDCKHSRY